jgi:hypothetical protein
MHEDTIRCEVFNCLAIIALVVGTVGYRYCIFYQGQQAANTNANLAPNLQHESLLSEDVFQCEGRSFLSTPFSSKNSRPKTSTGCSLQISFYFHGDRKLLSTSYFFK